MGKKEGGKYDAFSRRREKRRRYSLQASLWGLTGGNSSRRLACRKEAACREQTQMSDDPLYLTQTQPVFQMHHKSRVVIGKFIFMFSSN